MYHKQLFRGKVNTQYKHQTENLAFRNAKSKTIYGFFKIFKKTNQGLTFYLRTNYYCSGGLVAKLCPTRAIPWMVAHQAPLSMGFSRQEY